MVGRRRDVDEAFAVLDLAAHARGVERAPVDALTVRAVVVDQAGEVGHRGVDRRLVDGARGFVTQLLVRALQEPGDLGRALTRERVMAGLAAAKRRGRQGGRPPMIDTETLERITAALDGGASKASVCRTFKVPRSTLIGTLARIGWAPPAKA